MSNPKRTAIVAALVGLMLVGCGSAAPAENGCGANTTPCTGGGDTLPRGWSVTEVQVGGRTVTCIVWKGTGAYSGDAPAMSCDWSPK